MRLIPLGELISSSRSGFASGKRAADGAIQLRMNNVSRDGSLSFDKVTRVPASVKQLRELSLEEGDVLFNCTNSPELVGKTCLFRGHPEPVVFSNHFVRLRTKGDSLVPDYLARWLTWTRAHGVFSAGCVRWVNQATYKKEDLLALRVPLPPLPEQKRIAAILDSADALRAKRRESIEQLDSLIQATFLEMFGDPVTNPKGWPRRKTEDFSRLVRGSSPRPKGDKRFYGGPVPRLMVGDITRDGFRVTPNIDSLTAEGAKKSRPVPAGTVVMAVSGDVGVVSTVDVDCCVHDGFVAFLDLDESKVAPFFLMLQLHLLKMTHETRKAGAIFQNLTTTDIKAMEVVTPPIATQHHFIRVVESIEQQKARLKAHLAELDTLFASLQSRAFNGELVA
jgi:type I restriction enzyme S subunit